MLRPASPDALIQLRRDASACDRELDRALCDVGVLPPADLTEIRDVLTRVGTEVARSHNSDGHVILQVMHDARPTALIHHDGRVQVLSAAA